jgi:predicted DCC family thiol-disulfide oxidoreductase YuxK
MKACMRWRCAALASGLLVYTALHAEPGMSKLREIWLQCDRLASTSLVDPGTAAECSRVHEQLLQREFNGDFGKMLAWWKANRVTPLPAPRPAARKP